MVLYTLSLINQELELYEIKINFIYKYARNTQWEPVSMNKPTNKYFELMQMMSTLNW